MLSRFKQIRDFLLGLALPALRKKLLIATDAQFRIAWVYNKEKPHFFDQQITATRAFFKNPSDGVDPLFRGFYSAECVRPGDRVLDIGCGDGFYAARFFAPVAARVDAIDLEPSAITHALKNNPRDNVSYALLDAVSNPFPSESYDVIVFDGALGHIGTTDAQTLTKKIAASLSRTGVFCGSESLGTEGHDHLQFFKDENALASFLKEHFAHVSIHVRRYPIGGGFLREEAYWRCAHTLERLKKVSWQDF